MSTILSENFDGVTAPTWVSSFTVPGATWATNTSQSISSPNSAYLANNSSFRYAQSLTTDGNGGNSQLTFYYRFEGTQTDTVFYINGNGQIVGTQDGTTRLRGIRFNPSTAIQAWKKVGTTSTSLANIGSLSGMNPNVWYYGQIRGLSSTLQIVFLQRLDNNYYLQTDGTFAAATPPMPLKTYSTPDVTGVGYAGFGSAPNGASGKTYIDNFLWETYGGASLQDIAVNHPLIYYPPNVGRQNSSTIRTTSNPGLFASVAFTGSTLTAVLQCPSFTGTSLTLQANVDGLVGYYNALDSTTAQGQTYLASGLSAGNHQADLYIIGMSQSQDKWTADPPTMSFGVTGYQIDTGSSIVALPNPYPYSACLDGDSTHYGIATDRMLATPTTAVDDAMHAPMIMAMDALGICTALRCFSSNGYTVGGTANVPDFPNNWNYYYNGYPRVVGGRFIDDIDFYFECKGASDWVAGVSGSSVQSVCESLWPQIYSAVIATNPDAVFVKMVPPSRAYLAEFLEAGTNVFGEPRAVAIAPGGGTMYRFGTTSAYLLDMGPRINYGFVDISLRPPTVTASDSIHPDVAWGGHEASVITALMTLTFFNDGGGGAGGGSSGMSGGFPS